MRQEVWATLFCCLSSVLAQNSLQANEYPVEENAAVPLKQAIIFTSDENEEAKRAMLPSANLVVAVVSAPDHFEQREAVRAGWAQLQSLTDPKLNQLTLEEKQDMVIRFIIGKVSDPAIDKAIAKENLKYRDIVRVDVGESYFGLTDKTYALMKWAYTSYNLKFLMKCDDDSFVRIDTLLSELKSGPQSKLYMGKIWSGTPVDRRIDDFTPYRKYEPFAAGAGYVLSQDLVAYLVRNSAQLHKWSQEDVAVGMALAPLDITVIDHPHFHSLPEGCDKDMVVQNPTPPDVMREVFHNMVRGVPCHTHPDPFDPATKNVPDHVLLELGIAKAPEPMPGMMEQMAGAQTLLQADGAGMLPDMGMDEEEEHDEPDIAGDMSETAMNANKNNGIAANEMNMNTPAVGMVAEVRELTERAATAADQAMNDPDAYGKPVMI